MGLNRGQVKTENLGFFPDPHLFEVRQKTQSQSQSLTIDDPLR